MGIEWYRGNGNKRKHRDRRCGDRDTFGRKIRGRLDVVMAVPWAAAISYDAVATGTVGEPNAH